MYGSVHDAITGAPLARVRVQIGSGGSPGWTSDSGLYAIQTDSAGTQPLSFQRPGYAGLLLNVTVPTETSLRIDIELDPEPVTLPPLAVASGSVAGPPGRLAAGNCDSCEIGLRRFSRDSLWSDPLAIEDDPILAASTPPGTASQAGLLNALHVHGGSGDQNLVVLDGLPVYGAMHLGGAASLINPDAVDRVDLHTSVPSSRYGGRLSSAIELQLRSPVDGDAHLTGAWDPRAVRQLVEGSFAQGAGSILVSGRQSYRGVFAQDGDGWRSNGFHDVLTRGSFTSGVDDLRLYLLQSGDRLSFPAAMDQSQQQNAGPSSGPHNRFAWSSGTMGAVWLHAPPSGPMLTTRLWSASSAATIEWAPSTGAMQVGSELHEIGLASELLIGRGPSSRQRIGVSVQRTEAAYRVSTAAPRTRLSSTPTILSGFAEDRRTLGSWSVSTGFRASSVNATDLSLEPRFSVRYQLSPAVGVSAGAARLHQYVQSMRNEESLLDHAFSAELPVAVGAGGLRPALSDQLTAEVETRLGRSVIFTINAYARRFAGLLAPAKLSAAPFAPGPPPVVSGHAGGIELEASYHGRMLEARLNMGLADTERNLGSSEFLPAALRSRWAAVGVIRRLDRFTAVRLTNTLSAGGPTSIVGSEVEWQSPGGLSAGGEISGSPQEIMGSLNSARLPLYFRTDLGISRHWPVTVVGRGGLLTTTLTVTNLLDRKNVLGYVQDGSVQRALLFPSRTLNAQLGWQF